jgi:hypothetical protein
VREPSTCKTTIGIDLAKNVFQVMLTRRSSSTSRCVDHGVLPFFSKLAPCLIGMECASAPYAPGGPITGRLHVCCALSHGSLWFGHESLAITLSARQKPFTLLTEPVRRRQLENPRSSRGTLVISPAMPGSLIKQPGLLRRRLPLFAGLRPSIDRLLAQVRSKVCS